VPGLLVYFVMMVKEHKGKSFHFLTVVYFVSFIVLFSNRR